MFSEIRAEIIWWLKKVWFEAKLKARLQMIEWQNLRESEEERISKGNETNETY